MKVKNRSGLTPLGQAVLVEPYEPQLKSQVIEIPISAKERMTMAEQRAVVIEIGPEAWKDEKQPRAQVGDKVMVAAYAGMITTGPLDGRQYRVINARDIFLRITDEVA